MTHSICTEYPIVKFVATEVRVWIRTEKGYITVGSELEPQIEKNRMAHRRGLDHYVNQQ